MKDVKDSQRMAKGWSKEIREDATQGKDYLNLDS
jgi:hypothetical protein